MAKPYDIGLIVGRFQSFHIGHQHLIDTALLICDRVLIMVGSAQESGTLRNPYSIATRIEMIKEVYPDNNVIVQSLVDLSHEGDVGTHWGDYLIQKVHEKIYKNPDVIIYGNEGELRGSTWFTTEVMGNTTELVLNRNTKPISATMQRESLMFEDYTKWIDNTPSKLHKHMGRLREELMAVKVYKDILTYTCKRCGGSVGICACTLGG